MQFPKHILLSFLKVTNFIGAIWICFFMQLILKDIGVDISKLGIIPQNSYGFFGIVFLPFIHMNFNHIINNSIGLLMSLLPIYISFKDDKYVSDVVFKIIIISGIFVWVFGRNNSIHMGSSALIYGLVTYTIIACILYQNPFLIFYVIVNLFWMRKTLLNGLIPDTNQPHIGWEGHICGAVAGVIVGLLVKNYQENTSLNIINEETKCD